MSDKTRDSSTQGSNAPKPVQPKDQEIVKVVLAALDYKDKELIRGWRNHFDVWKWCRQFNPISDVEQEKWFLKQSGDPSIQMYKIMVSSVSSGKEPIPVGVCGFTSIDHLHRRAEFSLYIAAHLQGRGYGKAGLHLLLHYGFHNMNFHVVWGETFDGNPAAKMFESKGFVKEGTRRDFYFKNGKFIDAHIYSIKEDEWHSQKLLSLQ